jgi:hypothetical protein
MPGKIYIASMNMRGRWAEPICDNPIKINVTSSQAKTSKNRIAFSPMQEVVGGYKGYYCFENYWQSGKVYENIPIITTKKWWKELEQPKRRYPNSKGKKVLYATFDGYHDSDGLDSDGLDNIDNLQKMDYITSRKKVYVPEYYNLIKDNELIGSWKEKLDEGHNLIIYDFDGPRLEDGSVSCVELTEDLLKDKINDPSVPFGHGYIVGATIEGIEPSQYLE